MVSVASKNLENVNLQHSGVDAEIQIACPYYTQGSTVRGKIVLRVRRRIEHSGIYIRCGCHTVVYRNPKPITQTLVNTEGRDEVHIPPGILDAGRTEFSFEFVLSQCIPQSCMVQKRLGVSIAEVKHSIFTMIIFLTSADLHATKEFIVKKRYTSAPIEVSRLHPIDTIIQVATKNIVGTVGVRNDVLQVGKRSLARVELNCAKLPKFIRSAELILERRVTIHSPGPSETMAEQALSSGKLDFWKDTSSIYKIHFIELPTCNSPSVTVAAFSCAYYLVLRLKPFGSTKSFDTELQMRVGLEAE